MLDTTHKTTLALLLLLGAGACTSEVTPGSSDSTDGQSASGTVDTTPDGTTNTTTDGTTNTTTDGAALTSEERESLLYMREEEKLARDVYLLNTENRAVFANIVKSEEQHMSLMLDLLSTYGIEDPVGDNAPGVFVNADLQALYDTLAARSQTSIEEALRVGAEIEEIDLLDLDDGLANSTHDDIAAVYDTLALGSRNHLRAFARNLSMLGETYAPQYLPASEYEAIVSGDMETGSGMGGM